MYIDNKAHSEHAMHFVWIAGSDNILQQLHGYADPHAADREFTSLCQAFGHDPGAADYDKGCATMPDGSRVCMRHAVTLTHADERSFNPPGFEVPELTISG